MYAKDGEIGGWIIGPTSLTSGGVAIYSADQPDNATTTVGGSLPLNTWRFKAGNNFGVTSDGALYCTFGKIGGWEIGPTSLKSGNVAIYSADQTDGTAAVGNSGSINTWRFKAKDAFGVTSEGKLYSTSGSIGGWEIGPTSLTSGNVAIYSADQKDSIKIGSYYTKTWRLKVEDKFGVTSGG
jgi:hypothetical protein